MCHGRTALVDGHVVRDNTNSAKWQLTHTTYSMVAFAAVVVRCMSVVLILTANTI